MPARLECATFGIIIDYEQNDSNDMRRVMAPATADTLVIHFEEKGRDPSYYDMVQTGDLDLYGKEIVKEYYFKNYEIYLSDVYNDCGIILYYLGKQEEVKEGFAFFIKKIKTVLFLATGVLFSPLLVYQKENINSICHAVSLEVV